MKKFKLKRKNKKKLKLWKPFLLEFLSEGHDSKFDPIERRIVFRRYSID